MIATLVDLAVGPCAVFSARKAERSTVKPSNRDCSALPPGDAGEAAGSTARMPSIDITLGAITPSRKSHGGSLFWVLVNGAHSLLQWVVKCIRSGLAAYQTVRRVSAGNSKPHCALKPRGFPSPLRVLKGPHRLLPAGARGPQAGQLMNGGPGSSRQPAPDRSLD